MLYTTQGGHTGAVRARGGWWWWWWGGDCLWLQKSKEWVRINSWKRCTAVSCSNIRKWGWLCEWPLYAPELCETGIIRYPRCVFHFFPLLSAAIFVFKQGANLQCKNLMWVKCINCCSWDGLVKGSVTDDSYISCTCLICRHALTNNSLEISSPWLHCSKLLY